MGVWRGGVLNVSSSVEDASACHLGTSVTAFLFVFVQLLRLSTAFPFHHVKISGGVCGIRCSVCQPNKL